MLTCNDVRELAPELALGVLDGVDRAEALNHTETCTACRGLVADFTQAADALPLAVAESEPPDGFEQRVLRQIGSGRRRNRRVVALVAVAAAAAAILSIVGVRMVEHDASPSAPVAIAPESVRATVMTSNDGGAVGWAYVSDGRPATVAVSVAYWLPEGEYEVQLRPSGATPVTLGNMMVVDNRGSFTGVTEATTTGEMRVSLVDATGRIVCEGTLV